MRSLKKIWVAVIVSGVCVIVKNLNALVECVEWKDDENLFPLGGGELIAEKWNKVPEDSADS